MNQSKVVEIRFPSLLSFIVRESEFHLTMEFTAFLSATMDYPLGLCRVSCYYVALGATKRWPALGGRRQWALAGFPQRALSVCCVLHLGIEFLFPRCCREVVYP